MSIDQILVTITFKSVDGMGLEWIVAITKSLGYEIDMSYEIMLECTTKRIKPKVTESLVFKLKAL